MKLFYSPGACSLAPHIALHEVGTPFNVIKVDLASRQTECGDAFLSINPSGKVPALALDSGEILTENLAVLCYIADQNPDAGLAPVQGSLAHYNMLSRLSFLSSEVHQAFMPLFTAGNTDEKRAAATEAVTNHLAALDKEVAGKQYYVGDQFTLADLYLFVVLGWPQHVGIDLSKYAALKSYAGKIAQRPAVGQAFKAEGLN